MFVFYPSCCVSLRGASPTNQKHATFITYLFIWLVRHRALRTHLLEEEARVAIAQQVLSPTKPPSHRSGLTFMGFVLTII